ncbi:MAG: transglutaminase-like domain-containing protein [Solirubrobacteraceae bacterium MAG38_C4-C5]|nr:transglutaminase-like domain-containing protein [Candidatus Siliceabacter maunaloa]
MPIAPFTQQARAPRCPEHTDLLLALAAEFASVDEGAFSDGLDALAAPLMAVHGHPPIAQMLALRVALRPFRAATAGSDGRSVLLVHDVLERRAGDPTLLVCLGAELGRRAGIPLGVIGDGHGRHLLAHRTMNEPVALDPVADRPVQRVDESGHYSWRCAHQVVFVVLGCIAGHALLDTGEHDVAEHATRLRLTLPIDHPTRAHLDQELAAVLAEAG